MPTATGNMRCGLVKTTTKDNSIFSRGQDDEHQNLECSGWCTQL